jgi:hypothetical protein
MRLLSETQTLYQIDGFYIVRVDGSYNPTLILIGNDIGTLGQHSFGILNA